MSWNSCQKSESNIMWMFTEKWGKPSYDMFWGHSYLLQTLLRNLFFLKKKQHWVAKNPCHLPHRLSKPCYRYELRLIGPARHELRVSYSWGSWDTRGGLCTVLALGVSILVRAEIFLSWCYNSPLPTVPAVIMVQRYIIVVRLFPLPTWTHYSDKSTLIPI